MFFWLSILQRGSTQVCVFVGLKIALPSQCVKLERERSKTLNAAHNATIESSLSHAGVSPHPKRILPFATDEITIHRNDDPTIQHTMSRDTNIVRRKKQCARCNGQHLETNRWVISTPALLTHVLSCRCKPKIRESFEHNGNVLVYQRMSVNKRRYHPAQIGPRQLLTLDIRSARSHAPVEPYICWAMKNRIITSQQETSKRRSFGNKISLLMLFALACGICEQLYIFRATT